MTDTTQPAPAAVAPAAPETPPPPAAAPAGATPVAPGAPVRAPLGARIHQAITEAEKEIAACLDRIAHLGGRKRALQEVLAAAAEDAALVAQAPQAAAEEAAAAPTPAAPSPEQPKE